MDFVFSPADILLPECDMKKWAVIACDQYTSEPEYWEKVKEYAGGAPSALNLILPEVYLKPDNSAAISAINGKMEQYLESGLFKEYKNALVFVERTQSDGRVRLGIVGKIDLAEYDYNPRTDAAIRATEKTVVSRIPPRVKIREDAPLELPHIMLLLDDPKRTVTEYAASRKERFAPLYDFELMLGGGHIKGSLIDGETAEEIISALKKIQAENNGFLFSVGDGNHSLATAKECYNKNKNELSRYALAEVVNLHDPALDFEPIYRTVSGVDPEKLIADFKAYCEEYGTGEKQDFACYYGNSKTEISVNGTAKLAVGTLQEFLDGYKEQSAMEVDYIHGEESLIKLSAKENTVGFIFKGMEKQELFPSVTADGSLPRKTFSMGHANDKRFYVEARKIK